MTYYDGKYGHRAAAWRANATRFIQSRLGNRNRYFSLYKNFKRKQAIKDDFNNRRMFVGWTAPNAAGKAGRAQYLWRKAYFKKHGRVI